MLTTGKWCDPVFFVPCVKGVLVKATFWAGIPAEVTEEADVVPRSRLAIIGIPFQSPHTAGRETVVVSDTHESCPG